MVSDAQPCSLAFDSVGRTARAGAVGSAYTFLLPREKAPFFRMRKKVDSKKVNPLEVTEEEYANLMDRYSLVLQELQASLVVSGVWAVGVG